ncbi:MAG: tetratricopeptide repeat protein [Candidatus Kariarchaeaceae archaeon]|jgi:tetratricopeptide (TPR) repeat protein
MSRSFFSPAEIIIEELFSSKETYTVLAGAGVSIDAPSNIPSAISIVHSLIELCAPSQEIKQLKRMENLRYEWFVSSLQENIDQYLRFMDYFELMEHPNIIHYFLGQMILHRNYVITTNFDYQIENALISLLKKSEKIKIIPIATKKDFEYSSNPDSLIAKRFYPVFKIHGSKQNIITKENTIESLITTKRALGRNKLPGDVFALEPYKQVVFDTLMKDRTLIVLGYSGSDDFDISPVLKDLTDLKSIIWIDHSMDSQMMDIRKVEKSDLDSNWRNLSKIDKLLVELRSDVDFEVYKVQVNSSEFIQKIWSLILQDIPLPEINDQPTDIINFRDWVGSHYQNIPNIAKYRFAYSIYSELQENSFAKETVTVALGLDEVMNNTQYQCKFTGDLAATSIIDKEYETALSLHLQALELADKIKDPEEQVRNLASIGIIYQSTGKFDLALNNLEKGIKIAKKNKIKIGHGNLLRTLGSIYFAQKDHKKAIKSYKNSIKIYEKIGEIVPRIYNYNDIGVCYEQLEKRGKAYDNYKKAIEIAEQVKIFHAMILYNTAIVASNHFKDYDAAAEYLKKALKEIDYFKRHYKERPIIASMPLLYYLAIVYLNTHANDTALNYFQQALEYKQIFEEPMLMIDQFNVLANIYWKMGEVYHGQNNLEKAEECVHEHNKWKTASQQSSFMLQYGDPQLPKFMSDMIKEN